MGYEIDTAAAPAGPKKRSGYRALLHPVAHRLERPGHRLRRRGPDPALEVLWIYWSRASSSAFSTSSRSAPSRRSPRTGSGRTASRSRRREACGTPQPCSSSFTTGSSTSSTRPSSAASPRSAAGGSGESEASPCSIPPRSSSSATHRFPLVEARRPAETPNLGR